MRQMTLAFLAVIVMGATGLFWGAYAYFKAQELTKAEARLSLYRSTVEAELLRFSHLPFVLSLDPSVARTLQGADPDALNRRLDLFAESAGVDAIYLMDATGQTIAASNAFTDQSFVGQNYAFRPYFSAAMQGQLGQFYGIGATTGVPGYFYASAVRLGTGDIAGAIAIKIDLSVLQNSWQAARERILLANADGVVLLASDPAWRYRALDVLDAGQRGRIAQARQFGSEALETLEWQVDPAAKTASISGQHVLHLTSAGLPNEWTLHFFAPDDQAVANAWLASGAWVVLGGFLFIVLQVRRVRRIGLALQRSESEEAALRAANARLAVEIEDRRTAEAQLRATQAELAMAGRLAALGQLASSVTHELGQPIAAMRNHIAASEMSQGASALTSKMQGLVDRMEAITRQLKFFSRKGRDQFEDIDLHSTMCDALELLAPSLAQTSAVVHHHPPDGEMRLRGNRLRVEQVMTNIVRNALDAVEDEDTQVIEVVYGQDADTVWFEVHDTGHGIGDLSIEDLREPFATTRESGRGMGLGLTISAGIVQDHNGSMTAHGRADGGTVFRVSFPRTKPQEVS